MLISNNRFISSFEKEEQKNKGRTINFGNNFKSKKFTQYQFNNFYESKLSLEYEILKKIYNDYKNGINIIEKYFNELKYIRASRKIPRMFDIINNFTGANYSIKSDIGNIFKLDLKDTYKNKAIRFYFYKSETSYNLLLIDLYHLVIWTNYQDLSRDYNRVSSYSGNISNIR